MKIRFLFRAAVLLTASLATSTLMAQRPIGVDVSSYQGGSINWGSVRASGRTFAWAKATEGVSTTDSTFVGNINNGKAAGVYMGGYHFAHPNSNTPSSEAGHFWGVAGGYILNDGKTLMPMLDMEVFSGVVGASSYSDWANKWNNAIVNDAQLGAVTIRPAIYTSACSGCNFDGSVAQWLSDIADYNGQNNQTSTPWTACTGCEAWGAGVWTFWQYSSTVGVSGIPGNVDVDVFNGSAASLVSTAVAGGGTRGLINRVGMARTATAAGYWIVASDGGVFSFGDAQFYGSMGGQHLNAPIVGMAARPQGDGYWLVGSDGGIFTFGNAGFHGSEGGQQLAQPIVGMCSSASGNGYWLVAKDGGIFTFGDAVWHNSVPGVGVHVTNIVGMDRTPGNAYWVVGSDGGIYSFAAPFYGSMGGHSLSAPMIGMTGRAQGDGYWEVGADGGLFNWGNAGFHGGLGGITLSQPICGTASTPSGGGYWMVGKDGAIYTFGDAQYHGGANF